MSNRISPKLFGRAACGLLAVALVAGASACTAHGVGGGGGDATLRLAAVASGPFTNQFNPLLQASKDAAGDAQVYLYAPLLMNDMKRAEAEPWLVSRYAWSDGGKTLTLKLRPDLKWSDGKPLTAEDVAFTFELMRQHEALNFYTLPLAGASAPANDTAVVTFTQPAYQYEWWDTTPVPKHVWSSVPDPVKYTNPNPVVSGPFTLKTSTSQVITLRRNPHYWGKAPKVQTLQLLSYDSANSMVSALRGGQVDWITPQVSDPAAIAKLAPAEIGYWVTDMSPATIYLVPNSAQYPLSLAPVRRAISQAIDRGNVSKLAFGGLNGPVESPTGLDLGSRTKLIPTKYRKVTFGSGDAAEAKKTLESAGFTLKGGAFTAPDGTPLRFTITVPTSSPYGDLVRAATVMSQQLKVAGIDVTVKSETPVAWRTDVGLGQYQLALRGAGGNLSVYGIFNTIFDQELTPAGKTAKTNFERYENPQAQQLLEKYAAAAPGSPEEAAAAGGLAALMVEDAPVIPLFHVTYFGLWRSDRFVGWPSDGDPYALPIGGHINAVKVALSVRPRS
jgi:peptide/nickel transport system substrate-binding protein